MKAKHSLFIFIFLFSPFLLAEGKGFCVGNSKGVCVVPFDAIFFAKKSLLGERISVQGIVSVESDGIFFYPDHESKKFQVRARAIQIIQNNIDLSTIKYLDGKRLNFVGFLKESDGNYWASILLSNIPLEEPLPIFDYPPAPPPPAGNEKL